MVYHLVILELPFRFAITSVIIDMNAQSHVDCEIETFLSDSSESRKVQAFILGHSLFLLSFLRPFICKFTISILSTSTSTSNYKSLIKDIIKDLSSNPPVGPLRTGISLFQPVYIRN